MRKLRMATITAAAGLLFSVLAVPTATATTDDYADVRDFWTKHGVPEDVQDNLVEKYEETGELDAFDPETVPTDVRQIDGDGETIQVATYEDGSIYVSTVEEPIVEVRAGQMVPMSVTGCTLVSGAGWATYKNCLVSGGDGYKNMSFRATYEKYVGADAKIISTGSAQVESRYGTMTAPERVTWRPQATPYQNAVARYYSYWKSYNGASSETVYLALWLTASGTAYSGRS